MREIFQYIKKIVITDKVETEWRSGWIFDMDSIIEDRTLCQRAHPIYPQQKLGGDGWYSLKLDRIVRECEIYSSHEGCKAAIEVKLDSKILELKKIKDNL